MDDDQAAEPGGERAVLHRIPCPIATPPLLGVTPPSPEGHGEGDRCEGGQGPPSNDTVGSAHHRVDEHRQCRRQTDVQQWWMDRHRRVLQDRCQSEPGDRWDTGPFERPSDPDRQCRQSQPGAARDVLKHRRPAAAGGGADSEHDGGEEQQRPGSVAPQGGQPVVPRGPGSGVLGHHPKGEVAGHKGLRQPHSGQPHNSRQPDEGPTRPIRCRVGRVMRQRRRPRDDHASGAATCSMIPRTAGPYFSSFAGPTPATSPISRSVSGRRRTSSCRTRSWKTT